MQIARTDVFSMAFPLTAPGGLRRLPWIDLRPRLGRRDVGDDAGLVAGLTRRDQLIEAGQLQAEDSRIVARVGEQPALDAVEGRGQRTLLMQAEGLPVCRDGHALAAR